MVVEHHIVGFEAHHIGPGEKARHTGLAGAGKESVEAESPVEDVLTADG